MRSRDKFSLQAGFTLVELSIVLVIIGLIIGGVLVGRDLINAATVRAQISQIEKYNSAVNTFNGKYGGLPGDLALTQANQFGFDINLCDGTQSKRDGNGLIEGAAAAPAILNGPQTQVLNGIGFFAETGLFWEDLSASGLISGKFPNGAVSVPGCGTAVTLTSSATQNYFPQAKVGSGNYIYVYPFNNANWYGVAQLNLQNPGVNGTPAISVLQAYSIDKKMDDGLPTTGTVQAIYVTANIGFTWAYLTSSSNAVPDTATTCYNTTSGQYSMSQNGGAGLNCALSFQFK